MQFSVFRAGELTQSEFCIALDRLNVDAHFLDKKTIFSYFVKKSASRKEN